METLALKRRGKAIDRTGFEALLSGRVCVGNVLMMLICCCFVPGGEILKVLGEIVSSEKHYRDLVEPQANC